MIVHEASNCNVLVLDDDKTWLARHQDGLKRSKFNLYPTQLGNEAIELARNEFITFALIDEILKVPPVLKGEEGELQRWQGRGVIRRIREYGLDIRFAFITAAPTILSEGDSPSFIKVVHSLRTTAPGVVAVINKEEIDLDPYSVYETIINLVEEFYHSPNSSKPFIESREIHLHKPGLVVFENTTAGGINIASQVHGQQIGENRSQSNTAEDQYSIFQYTLGVDSMETTNHICFDNSNIVGANINSSTYGNQIGVQHNYASNHNLVEAAAEIQELLAQMEKTYPIITEADKQTVAAAVKKQIESRPQLKAKIVAALQSGGVEALKQLCQHPAAEIAIAAFEGWRTAENETPD